MPVSRSDRKDARPGEVLDAALDTFLEKGFAGTRMQDIAARLGVSKGTIYLYYASKEAVFEALVRERLVPNIARAEAMVAATADKPAAVQLTAILLMMREVLADPRRVALPKLVIAEAGNFPDLARFYRREVMERALGLLAGILRRGADRGEFRPIDPVVAARLFVAPVLLTAIWRTTFAPLEGAEGRFDPDALLNLHAEMFMRALRPASAVDPSGAAP